jgi:hypothetical protein
MDTYNITIDMSQDTVNNLAQYGYYLYAFKAVGSSISGGQPTVWVQTQNFSLTTEVTWEEQFSAYTSTNTNLTDGTKITASATYPINLGSTLQVTSSTGTGNVVTTGIAGAIEIASQVNNQFTCGIGQTSSAGTNILCALPLFGNNIDAIQPIEKVMLTFATKAMNTGTVVYQAFAPALLVDMSGAPGNSRTVSYDLNSNWQSNTAGWATQYPASTQLAPLLINTSSQMQEAAVNSLKQVEVQRLQLATEVDKIDIPEGAYTNVTVTPITGTGSLSGGGGTMSSFGMFSCGSFDKNNLPQIGQKYTIIATNTTTGQLYQFPGDCTNAGATSDFK